MYLIDTNIFLEIMLGQANASACKKFIEDNEQDLAISDYTVHSIGIILFKAGKHGDFITFLNDIQPSIKTMSVPIKEMEKVLDASKALGLDFDDAYQVTIAKANGMKIVTMDKHFAKVKNLDIVFL